MALARALVLHSGGPLLGWDILNAGPWSLQVVALASLYLLPGLALLRLLAPPTVSRAGSTVHLIYAMGISVALPPLLLLLSWPLPLPWTPLTTWGYVVVSAVVAFWPGQRQGLPIPLPPSFGSFKPTFRRIPAAFWNTLRERNVSLLLGGVSVLALVVRFLVVRDLPTGLFGDSYHHTITTQLLIDHQGLFQSWQPYAPLTTFTYHFGFHANAAFFHWMTGVDAIQSVLWTGQILNALSVPLAFALLRTLGGSPWAGLWAAVITGFVSTLPAHYVVWGRYPQLTGHLVLVVVVIAWIQLVETVVPAWTPDLSAARLLVRHWRPILLVGGMTAAMILTHYLVTLFAAAFVGSYLLVRMLVARSWQVVRRVTFLSLVLLGVVLVGVFPWVITMANSYLVRVAVVFLGDHVAPERVAQYAALPDVVPLYASRSILVGALTGLCMAGWERQWRLALPALWSVVLVLFVVPHLVGLPGTGIIDQLTALSALYLTLAPLAGHALATVQSHIPRIFHLRLRGRWLPFSTTLAATVPPVLAGVLLLAAVGWGTSRQWRMIDGTTQLVTHADMEAMAWIRDHTPPDTRFLVNSFPAYGGTVIAGTDAGWWLPFLTGRQSNLPPIIYGNELGEAPDYLDRVNHLTASLRGHPLTDVSPVAVDLTRPAAMNLLREHHISYIYCGARASPGPDQADAIDTARLRHHPAFHLVYARDGVEIFRFGDGQEPQQGGEPDKTDDTNSKKGTDS